MEKRKSVRSQDHPKASLFGIQLKLLIVLGFFAFILFLTASYGLYGVYLLTLSSQVITDQEIPLTEGINGALVEMLKAQFALAAALAVDDFSQSEKIRIHEADLNTSLLIFDAYIAAIAWGSESEAFRKSDGGLNFAEWQRLNLAGNLIIERPLPLQVQLAGITDIYFGGYARNAIRAIAAHKKFLRLEFEGLDEEAVEVREKGQEYTALALRFSDLSIDSLSEMVKISNNAIAQKAIRIETIQRNIGRNIFFIFFIGSIVFVIISFVLIRKIIVKPIQKITQVAQAISSGNLSARANIKSRDEIGILASVFNEMADRLAEYPLQLEKEVRERTAALTKANERLQEWLHENYLSAKLLVQRDRELVATNREMEQLNKELDEIGKMLVRRDMELTNSNERLRDLDAVKSQFVSIAAHQLRTPLAGIRWTLYALLEEQVGKLNYEQKKFAGDAYSATLRLINLINDLLDVARLEEGRFGFKITRMSFTPIVQAVFKRFQKNAEDKGLAFSLKLPRQKIPPLDFDEEKIMIVLENLIDNAIKYTAPGGSIIVRLAQDKNMVTVEVTDTGIGMPENQLSRVFTKFFRAQNAQLYQTSGTGLGLYLSKNIVEYHKGDIFFTTKENKGSTFTFSLPFPEIQNNNKSSSEKKRHKK